MHDYREYPQLIFAEMQNWDDLRFFLAIARSGTLAGAARALRVNHSTVFRRLNALEAGTGVRLFERLPAGYVLTEAGEETYARAARMHELMDELDRRLSGRDYRLSGAVRLTTTDTLATHFLHPLLAGFRERYPGIALELVTGNVFFDLSRREADVALRPADNPPPHLVGRDLAKVGWAVYASPGYLAGRTAVQGASDLAEHTVVAGDDTLAGVPAMRWLRERVPESAIAYRAGSFAMQCAAARAGIGLALLPCVLADPVDDLQRVLGPVEALSSGLWLLTHLDLRDTARIRAFMSFMTDAIRRERARLAGEVAP